MGKQTAIALTPADERTFLTFLRSIAEVKLIISFGPTVDSLWVNSFDCIEGYEVFYIGIQLSLGLPNTEPSRRTRAAHAMVIAS